MPSLDYNVGVSKPLPPVSDWAQEYVQDEPAVDWELTLWCQVGAISQIIAGAILGFAALAVPILFIPAFWLIIRGTRQATGFVPQQPQNTDDWRTGYPSCSREYEPARASRRTPVPQTALRAMALFRSGSGSSGR